MRFTQIVPNLGISTKIRAKITIVLVKACPLGNENPASLPGWLILHYRRG